MPAKGKTLNKHVSLYILRALRNPYLWDSARHPSPLRGEGRVGVNTT